MLLSLSCYYGQANFYFIKFILLKFVLSFFVDISLSPHENLWCPCGLLYLYVHTRATGVVARVKVSINTEESVGIMLCLSKGTANILLQ